MSVKHNYGKIFDKYIVNIYDEQNKSWLTEILKYGIRKIHIKYVTEY